MNRRLFMAATSALAASVVTSSRATAKQPLLARVVIDNDFAGDPDGLFQLAHHVLSRSVTIPLIIGSHLPASFASGHDARDSAQCALELLQVMKLDRVHHPIAGSETPMASRAAWTPSAASAAIVREAMRDDAPEPLVYVAGAGLTDLALAWLSEPKIGKRIRLVWIGGNTPPGLALSAGREDEREFNFSIDPIAARVIFNESDIEIWQVPASTYRQMLYSMAELEELAASGPLGAYLKSKLDTMAEKIAHIPGLHQPPLSDAYVLGDSPLVTLTALLTPIEPDAASSRYTLLPTPELLDDGHYAPRAGARPMRVYTMIDAALTFRDMNARFRLHEAGKL
ncbi:MAG: nucleoside hydrolase [Sphingomonadales bacterium]|nr:nucleoside hydrolase [Sphingomonadales bacterium]MDE2170726.1 nucleoside hydrolase [Sphingomonadales bacterium]